MEEAVIYKSLTTNDQKDIEMAGSVKLVPERNWMHHSLCTFLVACALVVQLKYLALKLYVYYWHPDELLQKPWLVVLALCECAYLVAAWVTAVNHLLGLLDTNTDMPSRLVSCCGPISVVNALLWATLLGALAFDWSLAIGTEYETRLLVTGLALHQVTMRTAWFALWVGVPAGVARRNRQESQFWWMTLEFVSRSKHSLKWHLVCVIASVGVVIGHGHHVVSGSSWEDVFRALALSLFLVTVSAHMLVPVLFSRNSASLIDGVTAEEEKWSWTVVPYEALSWLNLLFWEAVLAFWISHPWSDALHSW